MNPEIKAKWVAALRGGEYKQAQAVLRADDAFCCLGVLCDLHAKATDGHWVYHDGGSMYHGERAVLPESVIAWANIPAHLGDNIELKRSHSCLSGENDSGKSFAEIADIIEREL